MDAPKIYQVEFTYSRVERFTVGAFDESDIIPSIQSPPNGRAITGFDPPIVKVLGPIAEAQSAAIYLGPRHPDEGFCQQISQEAYERFASRIPVDIEGLPLVEIERIRRYAKRRKEKALARAMREAATGTFAERVQRPHRYKGTQMDGCFWCGDPDEYQIHQGVNLPELHAEDA